MTDLSINSKTKIVCLDQMLKERWKLKQAGRTLVFTNGCFDILHVGHAEYLAFARRQGDALVVGVNSDASVRRIKGASRPINNQDDRALLLAAMEAVDYIIIFDEAEPAVIVETILPDVLVKGEDWAHHVSGREAVEWHGGRVVLAPTVQGKSTTNTLKRILSIKKRQHCTERFIVTGGAGFIGNNLVQALNERGCDRIIVVDHLDHPAKEANLARLRFEEYMDKAEFRSMMACGRVPKVSSVFHLGACSSTTETDEAYLRDNNYQYTRDLCEWSLHEGARFIYASSAATYGDGSRGYNDDDAVTPTLDPLNLYGQSKHMFDLWALETGALRQIVGLKYFNVYGPGEDHKGDMRSLVNKAYDQILQTGEITLFRSHRSDYRHGEQDRDFIYVADTVAVTLFFYDHPEVSGLFNCGTGVARKWIDLANALFAAMDLPPKIQFIDMPERIRDKYQYHTRADMRKLRQVGYGTPFLSVKEGVRRYVREHLACLPKARYG